MLTAWPAAELLEETNQAFKEAGLIVGFRLIPLRDALARLGKPEKIIKMQVGPDSLLKTKGKFTSSGVDPDG